MTLEGVDYSGDHPDPRGLYAAGKRFACRYVGPGGSWKHLTAGEAKALTDAGLSIVCIASGEADGMLGGYPVGVSWAEQAHDHAVSLGMPPDRPIYMSCDFDVQAGQWAAVRECLDGAASVLGRNRVGIYGGLAAVRWAARDQAARWLWQTYAWSGGTWFAGAHARQYRNHVSLVGGTVDLNRAMVDYIGQWSVGGSPTPDPSGGSMGTYEDVMNVAKVRNVYQDAGEHPDLTLETVVNRIAVDALHNRRESAARSEEDRREWEQTHADVASKLDTIATALTRLTETPMIDAVAVAKAIAAQPDIVDTLAGAVAARLASIQGSITLTGSLSGGIVPPPA